MATATAASISVRARSVKAKYLLFGLICLMMAYVLRHNESFLINAADPVWKHYQPFKWYLLPHGIAGACALLLGPMQFSDRLRQRYLRLHRIVGRIYVAGALVAAPLGFYIQFFEERLGGTRSFSLAAGIDAILWTTTTAIAFVFVLRGKIQQHRQWMVRSYAVAIVFLEVRVISGLGGWDGNPAITEAIVWGCVAFALLFADIVLQWQELRRVRPAMAKAQVRA